MRRKLFLFTIILVFMIVLADYSGLNLSRYNNREIWNKTGEFSGIVCGINEQTDEKTTLIIQMEDYKAKVLLTVYDLDIQPRFLWKARISFVGTIERAAQRRNPNCFDYSEYLLSIGVCGVITTERLKLEETSENNIENILIQNRFDYINSLPDNSKGIISGILFGDKNNLNEDIYDQFRENGTAHILAVSGLHVGVLYGLIRKILGKKFSILTLCTTTLIMIIYCFLSLWSFSAVRATAMILMKEWGTYFDRRYDLLTSASAVAIVCIFYNPYVIFNAGFQMSFLAVLSISFFQRLLPSKVPDGLRLMLAVNLGLIPYQIYQFNILSVAALIANIPVIYVAGILMPFALAQFAVFVLTGSDFGLGFFTEALSGFLVGINHFLSIGNWGHFDVISMPLWILIFLYLSLFFVSSEFFEIIRLRKKKNILIVCELVFLMLALIIGMLSYQGVSDSDILFVDIGQGDCVHIKAGGKNMLIDGGGVINYNVGKKTLKPYLLKNRVRKVDMALATHLHTDHYKGLLELKEEGMIDKLKTKQTAGNSFLVGKNVKIKTLWPLNFDEDKNQDENENCSVFMIYYNQYKILITGDLDSEGEKKMLKYYKGTDYLKADILKVGHHGSKYSTCDDFLDAVNPNYAVIQVGKNNYGHPNPKVIEKCEEKGIILFRNDTHGCVGFSLSGDKITYGVQQPKQN